MQCGRDVVPEVRGVLSFDEMLDSLVSKDLSLFLHEKATASAYTLLKNTENVLTVGFAVGPEGGFTEQEAAKAESYGIKSVSVGKRILRAETVPICFLSVCGAIFE